MDYATSRHIPCGPTCSVRVKAEINILEIREIASVKQSNVMEDLGSDDQTRARDPICLASLRRHVRRHHPSVQQSADHAEFDAAFKLAERRREPKGRSLRSAIRILKSTSRDANIRM